MDDNDEKMLYLSVPKTMDTNGDLPSSDDSDIEVTSTIDEEENKLVKNGNNLCLNLDDWMHHFQLTGSPVTIGKNNLILVLISKLVVVNYMNIETGFLLQRIKMQSVPNNLNDIEKKLARHPNHKGLQAAYQSARNKRTPRVASILLVGLTGAGKSSTVSDQRIDLLFTE
ncbi:unnamed protein product [Rotaria magnacalcarata]|uniref:Uncharacterized protein n=2 Tax=Rotaria magnacalcarata TaxID=392030 RepID=A0A820EJW1_9BILA|nr:unnamed protein product [Rotaria magnacalcarata]